MGLPHFSLAGKQVREWGYQGTLVRCCARSQRSEKRAWTVRLQIADLWDRRVVDEKRTFCEKSATERRKPRDTCDMRETREEARETTSNGFPPSSLLRAFSSHLPLSNLPLWYYPCTIDLSRTILREMKIYSLNFLKFSFAAVRYPLTFDTIILLQFANVLSTHW